MNIAITGSKGYLGKNIVDYLKDQNHKVYEYDIKDNKDCLELMYDDISKIDVIIHLAAVGNVSDEGKVKLVVQRNIDNLVDICEYLKSKQWKGKFIFFSSAMIYAKDKGVYGMSKLFGEEIVKSLLDNWIIVRPYNIVGGKYPDIENGRILQILTNCVKNNKEFTLYNNGETKRFYVHMHNLLSGISILLDGGFNKIGVSKNFAISIKAQESTTINEVIKKFEIVSGKKIKVVNGGMNKNIVLDMTEDNSGTYLTSSSSNDDLGKAIKDHLDIK